MTPMMMLAQPPVASPLLMPPLRQPTVRRRFAITARAGGTLVLPTHPVHNAMRRGLLTFTPYHEEVTVRLNGQARRLRVRTWLAPRPLAETPPEAPARDANLLRTHLDLVDAVYAQPQGPEGVRYDMGTALARMGYKRLDGGGYHADAYRELGRRLQLLSDMRVGVSGQPGLEGEPLWRFFLADGAALVPLSDWEALKQNKRLVALPGAWYAAIELPRYRLPVARTLLQRPMDGRGHQVERLALLLAAELAVWERAEMHKGAHTIHRSLGALLDRAAAADRQRLIDDGARRLNSAKRLREYLAGDGFPDQGAFAILRDLGGFAIDIKDEAAFWASGRQWIESFWDARLVIGVRGFGDPSLAATGESAHGDWRDGPRPLASS